MKIPQVSRLTYTSFEVHQAWSVLYACSREIVIGKKSWNKILLQSKFFKGLYIYLKIR